MKQGEIYFFIYPDLSLSEIKAVLMTKEFLALELLISFVFLLTKNT